jgi:hypothetical protein
MESNNTTRKGLINDDTKVNIEREVSELIKRGADKASMRELRRKFGDDKIFDTVQEAYFEKLTSIQKRSIKFTKLIEKKYGLLGYPLHVILNKSLKYKKRYNLSEEEFELFRQYYQKNMNMRNNPNKLNVLVPNTNMAKVFGDDPYTNNKIYTSDRDHKIIKEIIDLYEGSRFLWQQITLQSILYQGDLSLDKCEISLNNNKMINFSSPIHPVVAALFLPKINNFDEYFLFTNLAYILKCKHLGEQLTTYHSYLMLYNLVTDATDVVCNSDSPLRDILHRGALQITLWRNVLKLREGSIYDTNNSFVASDFMINIDGCKLSTYDAPDLLMIGDENVIIRRLLNALSFRCATVMSTPAIIPLLNANINNTMQVNTLNIPFNLTQINKVPMIYIRLPPKIINSAPSKVLTVQDSLSTTQTVMSNGKLESRSLTVATTEQLLIISIPRRTYKPIGTGVYNLPQVFNFSSMPHHAIGLEVLNDTPVATNKYLTIYNSVNTDDNKKFSDKLFLKSAVVLKERTDSQHNKFIYGTKTYIINYNNLKGREVKVYNPISDIQKIQTANNNISMIPLRYLTSTFCNQIVRNATTPLPPAPARRITEKYLTSLEEEDKIHDFLQRQTILIYTNELKNNSDVQSFLPAGGAGGAGGLQLNKPTTTSPLTHMIQYNYNTIINSSNNANAIAQIKDHYILSIVKNIIVYVYILISTGPLVTFGTAYLTAGSVSTPPDIQALKTAVLTTFNATAYVGTDQLEQDIVNEYQSSTTTTDSVIECVLNLCSDIIIQYLTNDINKGNLVATAIGTTLAEISKIKTMPIEQMYSDLSTFIINLKTDKIKFDFNKLFSNLDNLNKSFTDYKNFGNNITGDGTVFYVKGTPLKEGNHGNQQLNNEIQFTMSKYVGDFPFIDNTITYMIEGSTTPVPGAAPAAPIKEIGILKTDIGLVPGHF